MTEQELQKLKYPIGKFDCPNPILPQYIESWISILEHFPNRLENLVENLSDDQLNTPYRPEGWTVRQTIHHLADSHLQSYARFKWALTEDKPIIKAYDEEKWAELFDSKTAPVAMSLLQLRGIHLKWVYLLKGLNENDLNKSFIHPATQNEVFLKHSIGMYAWHSNHHYAHIEQVMKRNNWL